MHPVAKSLVDELDNHIRILQAAKSAVIMSSMKQRWATAKKTGNKSL